MTVKPDYTSQDSAHFGSHSASNTGAKVSFKYEQFREGYEGLILIICEIRREIF